MAGEAEAIFRQIDTDGSGSLDMAEMHAKLSDFGLGERQIEQVFLVLDTDNDGEVSLKEFVAGFDKFCTIRDGGAATFNSGPVHQWGFQKWKLDRWLAFDGKVISVYKCPGKPAAGAAPHYTIPMDVGVCFKDPSSAKRFSIDTGFSMVHFRTDKSSVRDQWCDAFTAAQVSTTEQRVDLIKQQKKYKDKITGTSGDYYLGDQLGEGGFAKVRAAIHAETGHRLAAKIMDAATAAEEEHKREIVAMAALKHESVVGLHDVVYVPRKKKGTGSIYIMLEQCTGGELFSRVVDNGCLSEAEAMYFFRQILEGMMYCHSRKICHRDMKLENLLLDGSGKRVKITDFGFAKNLADDNASTVLGTAVYVAPEVLKGEKYDGMKVDMWACGVVLFAMCVGAYPFDSAVTGHGGVGPEQKNQNAKLMHALLKADYKLPSDVSPGLKDLLSHLIQPDADARYTAAEALKHPWCLGADCPDAGDIELRTTEDIDKMQAAMSTAYIETPEGDNPELWLEKIKGAGLAQSAEAEAAAVDVDFDEADEAEF